MTSSNTPTSVLDRVSDVVHSGEEFVRIVQDAARTVSKSDCRLRGSPELKYLFDELLPLAAFIRAAETLDRKIACRYVRGNQSYDAELTLSGPEVEKGYCAPTWWAEVTVARHPLDYLHREALETKGGVFPGNKIKRVKPGKKQPSVIENEAEAVDGDAFITDASEWVREALLAKQQNDYPEPALLVIGVEPIGLTNIRDWARMHEFVAAHRDPSRFARVAVVHWPTNFMFWV